MNHINRLGLDIGGVLKNIGYVGGEHDDASFLRVPPLPNAFETLRLLSVTKYPERIWIISKAGPKIKNLLRTWLVFHHFFDMTLINNNHVLYVDDDKKKPVYAKKLKLTHFIDDKQGVLQRLADIGIHNLYLYKPTETRDEIIYNIASKFTIVRDWKDIRRELLKTD